jgi:hypothetical protein
VDTLGISFDDYSNIVASICQETSSVDQNEDHAASIAMIDENQSMRASLAEIDKMGTMVFSATEDKLALFATLIPHIEFVIPDKYNDVEFKVPLFSVLPTVVPELELKQVFRVKLLLLQHYKTRGRVFSNQKSMMREQNIYFIFIFNFRVDCMLILGRSI